MPRLILLGFCILLLVTGWWVLTSWDAEPRLSGSPRGEIGVGAAELADSIPPILEGESGGGLKRISSAAPQAESTQLGWTGVLQWTDGSPAADVIVRARHPQTDLPICETRSDSQGRYRLPLGIAFDGFDPAEELNLSCDGCYAAEPVWPNAAPSFPFAKLDIQLERGRAVDVSAVHHADATPAAGVWINANCETEWAHEVFGQTDAFGHLILRLPHDGPWAFHCEEPGRGIAPEVIHWLKPSDHGVRLTLYDLPREIKLLAVHAVTRQAITHATFHGARAPDDIRRLPTSALADLPIDLQAQGGSLEMELAQPGLAYVKVEAEGYLTEIVEVVLASTAPHTIPLIPMESIAVQVTRKGKAVAATLSVGLYRRTLVRPQSDRADELAHHVQSGPMLKFQLPAEDYSAVQLPSATAPDAPLDFDLWIEVGTKRKYFGVLHRDTLPPPPWVFEMEPAQGELTLRAIDAEGEPQAKVSIFVDYQVDENARDAAGISNHGRAQRIVMTDTNGEVHLTLDAPSQVEARLSQAMGEAGKSIGRLEAEGALVLKFQVPVRRELELDALLATSGRVRFENGVPEGLRYDSLSLDMKPLDGGGDSWEVALDAEGFFSVSLAPGNYRAQLRRDRFAVKEGRSINFQAGSAGNLLLLPTPSGLLLSVRDFGSGASLQADDVDLWVEGAWLDWMEAYADGSAGSQVLFADRVEFDVEKEGYIPAFGVVDLRSGVVAEKEVLLHRARTLVFQYPTPPEQADSFLMWLDPPRREHPFVVEIIHGAWSKATTGPCHLQAVDGDHMPLGPPFAVEAGLADRTVKVPLY